VISMACTRILELCVKQSWQPPAKSDHVRLVARAEPLSPVRVASVFAEKTETTADSSGSAEGQDDGQTGILDKTRETVLLDDVAVNDGCRYYEQMNVSTAWIKLGLL